MGVSELFKYYKFKLSCQEVRVSEQVEYSLIFFLFLDCLIAIVQEVGVSDIFKYSELRLS